MTNMSGITSPQAKVLLEKLEVEMRMHFEASVTRDDIQTYLDDWKEKIIRENKGILALTWDIREEENHFDLRVVFLLEETSTSVTQDFKIAKIAIIEVKAGTNILTGPAKT